HQWQHSDSFAKQADYWRALIDENPTLPQDFLQAGNASDDTGVVTVYLEADLSSDLLTKVPKAFGTQINDVLLTVLMLTLRDWTGQNRQLIDLESHGRADVFDDIDLTATVGWFTALHTIALTLPSGEDLLENLNAVKQQLAQVPDNGIGYGVLRHLQGEALPHGEVLFNYLGQLEGMADGLFKLTDEPCGESRDVSIAQQGKRYHTLEINGQVALGRFGLSWSYSEGQYSRETIERLANDYINHLRGLVQRAQSLQLQPDLSDAYQLSKIKEQDTRPPLFIVPGVVSVVGYLRALAANLEGQHRVYGLRSSGLDSAGLDSQCNSATTVSAIAAEHLRVLRSVQPHGPYYLAGHSFGAMVAFEMAAALEQAGEVVAKLSIFDQPTRRWSKPGDSAIMARDEIDWLVDIAALLVELVDAPLLVSLEAMKQSNDPAYCYVVLMNWLKSHQGDEILFGGAADATALKVLVNVYRTKCRAFVDYCQSGELNCPIDVYCAQGTLELVGEVIPEYWGWGDCTRDRVEVYPVPGEHMSMFGEGHVKVLAGRI
ncbi:MAG: condensation domain-containing protein, partial [Psychrosphaera sp.]|nr:condensation domain-containing protein [Psychrosphaera sp.]